MLAQLIYEYNEAYNGILGYRRMTLYINILNQTNYSEKYIHRLMKVIGIRARIRRKKSNYIKSSVLTSPNLKFLVKNKNFIYQLS